MNDETTAATAPALTTVEEALKGSGRADVLNEFARMALGIEAKAAPNEGDGKTETVESPESKDEGQTEPVEPVAEQNDLSQSNAEETVEAKAPDDGEATEAADELSGKLDEHTQQVVNKRIAKEVGKTKAERAQREALETKLAELQQLLEQKQAEPVPATASPTKANPLAHVTDVKALVAERDKARSAQDQAEELLESLQDDPERVEAALRNAKVSLTDDSGNEDYSVPRMRKFLGTVKREARNVVENAVPLQAQYLDVQKQSFAKALDDLPELKDKTSERYARFNNVLRSMPELRNQPWWPEAAVVAVLGEERLHELRAAKAGPVKAKAKPELPVKIPAPKTTPPQVQRRNANEASDETVSLAIGGDKAARLKVIQSLVSKFS